ncbi:MAG TPA: hypothetical protein VLZ74_06945 [Methylocella sp.]|nr:hypothetical protein [Methylocella sp.]
MGDVKRLSVERLGSTPLTRLDAVVKRIEAMIQAVGVFRPPLTTLYNSLD